MGQPPGGHISRRGPHSARPCQRSSLCPWTHACSHQPRSALEALNSWGLWKAGNAAAWSGGKLWESSVSRILPHFFVGRIPLFDGVIDLKSQVLPPQTTCSVVTSWLAPQCSVHKERLLIIDNAFPNSLTTRWWPTSFAKLLMNISLWFLVEITN